MSDYLISPWDKYNETLIDNVHPKAWKNPKPTGRYNLIVVGGGTAGLVSAVGAAGLGAKVALIEKHLLGGDCLNYGCVPSKGVLKSAHVAYLIANADAYGTHVGNIDIRFSEVMERMRRLRAGMSPHDSANRLKRLGVDVYLGRGRFTSKNTIVVGDQTLSFSRAVIATGARAATLPISGMDQVSYFTNETVFSLTSLPKHLIIIGAGPIGCELSQAFQRLGSEVTVVSLDATTFPSREPEAAKLLENRLHEDGVQFYLGARIVGVKQKDNETVISYQQGAQEKEIRGDALLVAIGRAPNVEQLGLERADIEYDNRKGISVNDRLQTTNPKIYAAGDVCSAFKFTHAADAHARIVLQNALFFGRKKVSALHIPWSTYTDPEVAHIGIFHDEATARLDVETFTVQLSEIDRAVLDGETYGYAAAYVLKSSGKILGATIVARHAGEMISEVSLAMTAGLGLGTIARTIHPYPTQTEILKRLGDAYMRSKLTPKAKMLLKKYLGWRR